MGIKLLQSKKWIALLGIITLPLTLIAPAASAANFNICAVAHTSYCWQLTSTTGAVKSINKAGGTATAIISYRSDNLCGGSSVVTASCPFTAASGLNAKLKGHSLVDFYFTHVGACADSNSSFITVGGNCTGSHAAYVPVGNGYQYISVGASNQHGGPLYLSAIPGDQLLDDNGGLGGEDTDWFGNPL